MKAKILIAMLVMGFMTSGAAAQRVHVRLEFPAGIHERPVRPAPYRGAIWIGPEWRWHRGRYIAIPGYWGHPGRHHAIWVRGHWQYTRRGYRWIPGHWR